MNNSICITNCVIRKLAEYAVNCTEKLVQCERQNDLLLKIFLLISIVFDVLFIFRILANITQRKTRCNIHQD